MSSLASLDREFFESVVQDVGAYALKNQGSAIPKQKTSTTSGDEEHAIAKAAFSSVDEACQLKIMELVVARYPRLGIIAEETSEQIERFAKSAFTHRDHFVSGAYTLIIDPIDGSMNYLGAERQAFWGVSICVCQGTEPVCGSIAYPALGLVLSTKKGEGTFINGERVTIDAGVPYSPSDAIRLTGAYKPLVALRHAFSKTEHSGSYVVTLLGLLKHATSRLHSFTFPSYVAYLGKHVPITDIACVTLAWHEAGGAVLDSAFHSYNPFEHMFHDKTDNNMKEKDLFLLVPSIAYAQGLARNFASKGISLHTV